MNGDDKAKKLSAAKRKLKEFQKKQTVDVAFEEHGERFSQTGSVDEEHHSMGSGRINGSVPAGTVENLAINFSAIPPPAQIANNAHADDIERLQLERNLSPTRGNVNDVQMANYDHLLAQIEELKSYNVSLQKQILDEREAFGEQMQLQLGQLREQIQIHAQTIGILVSEKSQLQAALSQAKLAAESRQNENQELTGRLSASRQRVTELEKQLTMSSEQLQKAEKNSTELTKNVDRLKSENSLMTNSTQELKRRSEELHERFLNKESECSNLVAANSALKNELSMMKIYSEQLTANASKSDVSQSQMLNSQNEQLRSAKVELERLLKSASDTAEGLRIERDNIKRHHQTDLSGLQEHIASLNARITALSNEIEGHLQRNSELETSLNAANEQLRTSALPKEDEADRAKDAMITSLSSQLSTAKRDLEELVSNNVHIHQALVDKDSTIEALRNRIAELERASADYRSVLASVEDVRTALSRALGQNAKLKTEFEELQNAFVRVTNEKAEFFDQLESLKKQLVVVENKQAESLPAPSVTSRPVTYDAAVETDNQPEAVQVSVELPQVENHDTCQKTISELQNYIADLKNKVKLLEEQPNVSPSPVSSTTNRVEREVETDNFDGIDFTAFASADRAAQLETVQNALKQLEERFGHVMREKADLIDQRERLEHLVIQLQSETDTIGEYITLYQKQRSTLKQQSEENAKFMQQLTAERLAMKTSMDELQSLILKLVASRSQAPVRILSTGPDFTTSKRHHSGESSNSAETSPNPEKSEEEWPDLVEEEKDAADIDLAPVDPVSSRILQILSTMTSSLVTFNGITPGYGSDTARLIDASVIEQMTPNTRRLVSQRLHSIRNIAAYSHEKQSPGECPCCRGKVIVI